MNSIGLETKSEVQETNYLEEFIDESSKNSQRKEQLALQSGFLKAVSLVHVHGTSELFKLLMDVYENEIETI